MTRILISSLTFLFLFSCNHDTSPIPYSDQQIDSLKTAFRNRIVKKDSSFIAEAWTPLKQEDIPGFSGLKYFPYDIDCRFRGPIIKYENPVSMEITGSKHGKGRDDIRPAQKYGYFEFVIKNETHKLEIIKILPKKKGDEGHLFLGFWDETSGSKTYGGGRYVDLEQTADNQFIVDFNFAYNPYCAYSDRYSCAIPPFENRLKIAVKAGEKNYMTTVH